MFRRFPIKPLIKPNTGISHREPIKSTKEYDIEHVPYTQNHSHLQDYQHHTHLTPIDNVSTKSYPAEYLSDNFETIVRALKI